jgi:hypothetical protein
VVEGGARSQASNVGTASGRTAGWRDVKTT